MCFYSFKKLFDLYQQLKVSIIYCFCYLLRLFELVKFGSLKSKYSVMWKQIFLLFSLCLLLCTSEIVANSKNKDWDFLIFTQHWPITVCEEWKQGNATHTCKLPSKNDSWTIHGIWPTREGTMGPFFCNRTWHFDPEQVRSIESTLSDLWVNIEKETSTYSLWAHEWTKHGTCAAVLEPLNSEFKYFSTGLKWLNQYSMTKILSDQGIIPSDVKLYTVEDINKAIMNKLRVKPVIECKREKGKTILFELRICFDKNLKLYNCDGAVSLSDRIITNCGSEKIIYPRTASYMDQDPNGIIVQIYKFVTWLQWFTL